jgi:hypothetical protein
MGACNDSRKTILDVVSKLEMKHQMWCFVKISKAEVVCRGEKWSAEFFLQQGLFNDAAE